MNYINLRKLELKTFTEQDALDYCQLNNLNPDNIIELNLSENQLTDISGIKLFKNLEELFLFNNKITDISVLKDSVNLKVLSLRNNKIKGISVLFFLKKIKALDIDNLELEFYQIKYIKSLKKLKTLWCSKGFMNMSVLKQLNKDIRIIK